ncbi:SURF1 family protein [Jiella avicenniae]|nr:SURF1 family protein [Jiella avicenniae]
MARERPPRLRLKLALAAVAGVILFAGFVALGIWQIERRSWKLGLIAAVNERVAAAPVAAPGPDAWASIDFDDDEYRHATATGRFLPGKSVFAQATTDYGGGFWLMTPLRDARGFTVLVNRGFVPSKDFAADDDLSGEPKTVTGLLRMSQPGGGFLRANVPAEGRWYSRDVAAIAASQQLGGPVAPYFIDAGSPLDHTPPPNAEMGAPPPGSVAYPVTGLTRIAFRNQHLQYALTWFALAGLVLVAAFVVIRHGRRHSA